MLDSTNNYLAVPGTLVVVRLREFSFVPISITRLPDA